MYTIRNKKQNTIPSCRDDIQAFGYEKLEDALSNAKLFFESESNSLVWINDKQGNLYLPNGFKISKKDVVRLKEYCEVEQDRHGSYERLQSYEYATLDDFYYSSYFTSSDYCNGFVELSNRQSFLENFKHLEGVYATHGGYGTTSLVFKLSILNESEGDEIIDILKRLENYPVLDEDLLSELEMNEQNKSWEYFDYDFKRKIEEKFEFDFNEFAEDVAEKLYWKCINFTEQDFVMEGLSVYIDIEEMLNKINKSQFNDLVIELKEEQNLSK